MNIRLIEFMNNNTAFNKIEKMPAELRKWCDGIYKELGEHTDESRAVKLCADELEGFWLKMKNELKEAMK